MEIIVPAAGLSARFPGLKPKYLLKDNYENMMVYNALGYYTSYGEIYVGILEEHDEEFEAANEILEAMQNTLVHVVILETRTKGPADTVYQICKFVDERRDDGPIFIKDCDSFFMHPMVKGNYVCVSTVPEHETLRRLASKSFVQANEHGMITNIVEKKVVSDTFCVGGYKFEKRSEYMAAYEAISASTDKEIFVSHVIEYLISQGKQFFTQKVTDYVDVGTIDEWNDYLKDKGDILNHEI